MLRPIFLLALASTPALAGGPRHVTLQRSATSPASVRDCYIWQEQPTTNHNSGTLYTGLVGTTDKKSLLWFDVPKNVRVLDARLELIVGTAGGVPMRVHEVTQTWDETQPTWNLFSTAHRASPFATVTPTLGRLSIDVTLLAKAWASGSENNGIMLMQDPGTAATTYASSEDPQQAERPTLELVVEDTFPMTSPVPALEASCGVQLRYPLSVHAPGATSFTLSGAGPTVGATSGELSWKPTSADRGVHTWTVTASNGEASGELDVTVDVKCGEHLRVGCGAAPGQALALIASLVALRRRRRPARQPR